MKILIIRFSSIGDIVLTSPVVRCLKQQVPNLELHYATKVAFKPVLQHNPYIDKIHYLSDSLNDLIAALNEEKFDVIIDLHHNLRTFIIKSRLGIKSYSFNKNNWQKWLMVRFKKKIDLPHIVERYMDTVRSFTKYDGNGLDYFIAADDENSLNLLPESHRPNYVVYAIGGQFATKRMPLEKMGELVKQLTVPVVVIGGKLDVLEADQLCSFSEQVFSLCGKLSLNESAAIVKNAKAVISHDTGFMHIAAAYQKSIISIWGNTVPEFGMTPFYSIENGNQFVIAEVKGLNCRPCSKIGFKQCPKGHFNCMNRQNTAEIASKIITL